MSDKAIRTISFLLFFLMSQFLFAQKMTHVSTEELNKRIASGVLNPREILSDLSSGNNVERIIPGTNTSQASALCNCWIPRDASFQVVPFTNGTAPDYRNDDGSTNPIILPFSFCLYGINHDSVYINNNGNISFGSPYYTFTANSFPDSNFTMVAPFWADVDTRDPGSGLVYYSITPTHMIVQWDQVGYYSTHSDKVNSFQLIITDGNDPIIPIGLNTAFCYGDMQWTTGDVSPPGNVGGFGGVPATVGVNAGNGIDYFQVGLFDSNTSNYDGPYGLNDGVNWLDTRSININSCVFSSNIPPILNSLNICDTIKLCENTTYQLSAIYLSPELGQTTTINFFAAGMQGVSIVSNTPGNIAELDLQIIGQTSNLGYHTISITALDNGTPPAATTSNIVVDVMPAPLPSFTFLPASPVSANSPVSFTNTTPPGALLTWDFGDGSPTTTAPNPQHIYTTAGTYTVTLTAMFPNQCSTTITQQIVVTNCAPATFTINDVCQNAQSLVTFTGVASGSAVFTWNFNSGNIVSGSGSGPYEITWNTPGTYNIDLNVTDGTCSSSVSMPVNIFAIPVSSVTPLTPLCAGASPNVSFNGTAGPAATYTWNFGGATVLSGAGSGPYNLQFNNTGTDSVSLIVSDNGCNDTSQIYVQINPIPTADFTIPANACANDILNVNYTGTATAAANYTWDFNGGTVMSGSGQGPYTVSWNSGNNYLVSLTVTENGCASTPVIMPVDVTSIPVVSISPVLPLCIGDNNNVSFTGTAGGAAVYNWNFGNATVLSGAGSGPYNLQWNNAGTVQVQLSVNDHGCIAQSQISVTVNPIPTSDFVINNAACINDPVNLVYTGTATPAANYNWTFTNGNVVSGSGAGPYAVVWNTQGIYQVSLVVTENGCVSAQTDLQASVNPLPVVFAGNDQVVCSGTPAPLGGPAVAGEIYSWSPPTYLSDPAISNPTATPVNNSSATQQNNYILTVTDANGCINTDAVLIGAYPVPVIGFSQPASQCIKNNNFLLTATANIPGGVNYNWTLTPEATPASSTQPSISVVYSAVGTFPVMLTADYNGCPAQAHIDSITIHEMPVSDFIPVVRSGCEPLSVPFTNLSVGDGNTYNWDFGDGSVANSANPVHVFTHSGLYSVSLEAVNKYGCAADTSYKHIIDVYGLPVGRFEPSPQTANILAPIVQFQNNSTNAVYYSWDFGDGDTSTQWSPNHTYTDTGNYNITLRLISQEGCVETVKGVVRVEDNFSFYIPSAFTPNGDGVNDEFRGYGIAIKSYQMNIYDRWGKLIFSTDNYDKPWDGRMKTGIIQNDVYVYRIALTDQHNEQHVFVGDVTVMK